MTRHRSSGRRGQETRRPSRDAAGVWCLFSDSVRRCNSRRRDVHERVRKATKQRRGTILLCKSTLLGWRTIESRKRYAPPRSGVASGSAGPASSTTSVSWWSCYSRPFCPSTSSTRDLAMFAGRVFLRTISSAASLAKFGQRLVRRAQLNSASRSAGHTQSH